MSNITRKTLNDHMRNAQPLTAVLPSLIETGFIAFCGAGVSIPAPSFSPSWWTLTEEIIHVLFDNNPKSWNIPDQFDTSNLNRQPEEILENFANVLDHRFYKSFEVLKTTEPNDIHYTVAKLAKMGVIKACFTTNFDIHFERALADEGVDFDQLVDNIPAIGIRFFFFNRLKELTV